MCRSRRSASLRSMLSILASVLPDQDGHDEYQSGEHGLPVGADTAEVHDVAQYTHDDRAQEGAQKVALAAGHRGAADDGRGDGVHFVAFTCDGGC